MKKMATVQCLQTFHHGPELPFRQRIDGRIELAGRRQQIVRVIRRLVEPSLEYESGRGDKIDTLLNGVTTSATVQKRIHQSGIGRQIPRYFEYSFEQGDQPVAPRSSP